MRDGLVPTPGGSPNFGDSLEAVTLGGGGAAGRSPRRGVGRAGLAGRAGAGTLAFLPLSGEAPGPRRGSGGAGGSPEVRAGRARLGRRVRGGAGGGAGHTWRRSRATWGLWGDLKAPAGAATARRSPHGWVLA